MRVLTQVDAGVLNGTVGRVIRWIVSFLVGIVRFYFIRVTMY